MSITAERLRELLEYDPETGVFRWRVTGKGRRLDRVAGCVNKLGYRLIGVDGRLYAAHRLAWLYVHAAWPRAEVDHRNRDRADNRLANLREATHSQNGMNAVRRNRHGKGVYRKKNGYSAKIGAAGRKVYLGYFPTPEQARAAYVRAAAELHGEFART